jgi:hypothetical protein
MDFDEMEKDAATTAAPTDEALKTVAVLAQKQLTKEQEIADLEAKLKEKKDELRQVMEVDLPTAMVQIGMDSFTLESGEFISVERGHAASISKKNEAEAHKWLRDNGFGDLIKNTVTGVFGKEHDKKAEEAVALLDKAGAVKVTRKEGVHTGTLKAFVKEQLEKGANLPFKLLGIFPWQKSRVSTK